MTPIKLLIVDDHPLFRQGLRDLLETDARCQVVGEAADGDVALERALELQPDVVLMDINLPTMNGLQVTRRIKGDLPNTRVVVITGYDDFAQAFHALRAGASAYCSKDVPPESLLRTIYAVTEGSYVMDDRIMSESEVLEWIETKASRLGKSLAGGANDLFVPLSAREMEILEMVTQGASNKEIAQRLGISHQTVKNHMTAILRKLRVDDRTQAAVYALKHGWVRLERAR